ncbi:DNA topoisomerase II beta [Cladochytrium replicatum]|nr:DNA topoisomerase II beta [Cladochytrium replicatum]
MRKCSNNRWEVAFTLTDGQFQQVSFVNSICTSKGGTHTTHVADGFVTTLIEAVQKKDKKMEKLKPHPAKNQMWLFTKVKVTLKVTLISVSSVLKSGVVDNILAMARFKSEQSFSGLTELIDANAKNGCVRTRFVAQ